MDHMIRFTDPAVVVVSGAASLEGIDALATELLADGRYQPGSPLVFDRRRIELAGLAAEVVDRRLRVALEESELIGPRRVAVVAAEDEVVACGTRPHDSAWRRFARLDEARLWLGSVALS